MKYPIMKTNSKFISSVFLTFSLLDIQMAYSSQKDARILPNNILLIIVDDLRIQANFSGQSEMKTPNLDMLAKSGVAFSRAYCNVPVSGASRASLLSGLRPTQNRFIDYDTKKDTDAPNVPSLPKWFKNNGYKTVSIGKVYHHIDDDVNAWGKPPVDPCLDGKIGMGWQAYLTGESHDIILQEQKRTRNLNLIKGPAFEAAEVEDTAYPDGVSALLAIEELKKMNQSETPFFLAVGFRKPHLPFNAPRKYWDLYNANDIKLADNPYKPMHAPDKSMHSSGELRSMYTGVPAQRLFPDEYAKTLIHGYYASVSYVDAQIGKVLSELKSLGLDRNTTVIFIGDNGFHLGEHTLWCKHCNFQRVLNTPMIIKAPGYTTGKTTKSIVEFVDIYPTICDLAKIRKPSHLEGKTMLPILRNPKAKIKRYAYPRYEKGESVVSEHFSYTEWYDYKTSDSEVNMLYDLDNDPHENVNISGEPTMYKIVKKQKRKLIKLRAKLAKHHP